MLPYHLRRLTYHISRGTSAYPHEDLHTIHGMRHTSWCISLATAQGTSREGETIAGIQQYKTSSKLALLAMERGQHTDFVDVNKARSIQVIRGRMNELLRHNIMTSTFQLPISIWKSLRDLAFSCSSKEEKSDERRIDCSSMEWYAGNLFTL